MKIIYTKNGDEIMVDDSDYDFLSRYKWHLHKSNSGFYARGACGKMHNLIMAPDVGRVVDHIDGNGLNNTRENLRVCEPWQNNGNRRKGKKPTSSKYKGVYFARGRGRWCAEIYKNNKRDRLGYFVNEEDAARAYNAAALERWGEFAKLNVIE